MTEHEHAFVLDRDEGTFCRCGLQGPDPCWTCEHEDHGNEVCPVLERRGMDEAVCGCLAA